MTIRASSKGWGNITLRATQAAKIAPKMICPSAPMFHSPPAKVRLIPAPTSARGTQAVATSAHFWGLSSAPLKISTKGRNGGAPTANKSNAVKSSAVTIGPRLQRSEYQSFEF